MKVVIFCGGLGMRLREYSETIPKPMVTIGYRPILWHVMQYYAHFGHKDFILCLGYKGDIIKKYFLEYDETVSNDFVISEGGKKVDLLASDIHDWKITFVDTGFSSNIGSRLESQTALSGGRGDVSRQLQRRRVRFAAARHDRALPAQRSGRLLRGCRAEPELPLVTVDDVDGVRGFRTSGSRQFGSTGASSSCGAKCSTR